MNRFAVLRGTALIPSSLALMGLLSLTPAAQAEPISQASAITDGSPLAKFLSSSEYTDKLLALSKRWDRAVQFKCEEDTALDGKLGAVTIERPVEVSAKSGLPVSGSWRQRFTVKRCGKSQIYNAYILANGDQPLHVGALVPGTSRVTTVQARDAVTSLTQSVKTIEYMTRGGKACLDFALLNTEAGAAPQPKGSLTPGRFEEQWTVRYCDSVRTTPMCFTPLPEGGTKFRAQTCVEADKTEAEEKAKAAAEAAASAASAAAPASAPAARPAVAPAAPVVPPVPGVPPKPGKA